MLKMVPWYIARRVSRLTNLLWNSGTTNCSLIIISWKAARFLRFGDCWAAWTFAASWLLSCDTPVVLMLD
jgi:hypothetical protein